MTVTAVPDLSARTDFIPREDYISPEFAKGEKERLWPACWLVACREEDLAEPGQFYTFNIADDSIIINRDEAGRIQAHHNVCPHRGRRLTAVKPHAGRTSVSAKGRGAHRCRCACSPRARAAAKPSRWLRGSELASAARARCDLPAASGRHMHAARLRSGARCVRGDGGWT